MIAQAVLRPPATAKEVFVSVSAAAVRVPARALLVAVVTLVALAVVPRAAAHAVLQGATPASGAVVEAAPSEVVLSFSEAIETALGAIRVFAADGSRVDDGSLTRPNADSVATGLRPGIPDGTYTVAWRVVSADSHPVHGAYVFHVGAPGADPEGLAREVLASDELARSVSVTFTAVRFLTLGLTLFTVGGVVALVLVLTAGSPALRRALLVVLAGTAAALGIVSLFGIVLQGAEASGLGIGEAFDASLLRSVLDTRFGQVSLGRAAIAGALVLLLLAARRLPARAGILLDLALVLCVGLVLAPAAAGHANVSGALSFVADVVHVQAAAIWVGGLALVVLALLLARGSRWELAADAVPRFSQLALLAVVALLVAGIVNGYLQVRTWSGLWETSYGRLLLVKVALLVPLLALGAYNRRRSVPRLEARDSGAREQRAFLRSTGTELGLMVAVIAITAVLVAEPPARAGAAPAGPARVSTMLGELDLELAVEPARAGGNVIDLYLLEPSGGPADVDEVRVAATLPAQGLGPLRADARRIAIGHWAVYGFDFPLAGTWQLLVEARRGEFESLSTRVPVEIREAG